MKKEGTSSACSMMVIDYYEYSVKMQVCQENIRNGDVCQF